MVKNAMNQYRRPVGNHQFLEIAPQHEQEAVPHPGIFIQLQFFNAADLAEQIARPLDRPRYKLREEGYKQGIIDDIFLGGNGSPVYIQRITQRLEGIKGNAYGQQQVEMHSARADAKPAAHCRDRIQYKVSIFKQRKDTEIADERKGNDCLPPSVGICFLNHDPAEVRDDGRQTDQHGIFRIPAHVKPVAGNEQPHRPEAPGNDKQNQHHNREKDKK